MTPTQPDAAEALRRLAAAIARSAEGKGGDCAIERKDCPKGQATESLKFRQIDRDTAVSLNPDLEATDLLR